MTVEPETIKRAFDEHRARYAQRERAWDVSYHVRLWERARTAFERGSEDDFTYVYEELRRRWQAFRGGESNWGRKKIFEKLRLLNPSFFTFRLRELTAGHIQTLWKLLGEVEGLKTNSDGPSIVAMSKFLHFWNPRLFVIVDQGVIWNWVLNHNWLWDEVKPVRRQVDQALFGGTCKRKDATCDLSSYLAILLWSAHLLRENPAISTCFWAYIAGHEGVQSYVETYDAAAVEWFLLGLVEIPPTGVDFNPARLRPDSRTNNRGDESARTRGRRPRGCTRGSGA
jgi:hypothetical protein